MANKTTTFETKIKADTASFNAFQTQIKSIARSFKAVEKSIKESGTGIQKQIRIAFFGKRGGKTTISSFFKTQMADVSKSIKVELKKTMKDIVLVAENSFNKNTINLLASMKRQIDIINKDIANKLGNVGKNGKKNNKNNKEKDLTEAQSDKIAQQQLKKTMKNWVKIAQMEQKFAELKLKTELQNLTKLEQIRENYAQKKFKNSLKNYVKIAQMEENARKAKEAGELEELQRQIDAIDVDDAKKLKKKLKGYVTLAQRESEAQRKATIAVENQKETLRQAAFKKDKAYIDGIVKEKIKSITSSNNVELNEMNKHYANLQKTSKKGFLNLITQNVKNVRNKQKSDEKKYQNDLAYDKKQRDLLLKQVKFGVMVAKNHRKTEETKFQNDKKMMEKTLAMKKSMMQKIMAIPIVSSFAEFVGSNIKNPFEKLFTGVKSSFSGVKGIFKNVMGYLKAMLKATLAITAASVAMGVAMMTGIKKFSHGVLMATERMRGYQIGLLGMMKTMGDVNELMETSFKVAKKLPISYEQVYQSTKAFALIGPIRKMMQDTTKVEETLTNMYRVTMALSQIEPEWGMAGAQFSLREALSGDLRSLQRRFEIPVNLIFSKDGRSIRDLKNDPKALLETLAGYLGEFYNDETLALAARQFGAVLSKIEGQWFNFQQTIGNSGFYDAFVSDVIQVKDAVEAFAESDKFLITAQKISDSLTSIWTSVKGLANVGAKSLSDILGFKDSDLTSISTITQPLEMVAAIMRTIKVIADSGVVQKMFEDMYIKGKSLFSDVFKQGSKLIKSMIGDAKALIGAVQKTMDVLGLTDKGKGLMKNTTMQKGLIYTMAMGPGNMVLVVAGTLNIIKGSLGIIKLLSKSIGLSFVGWVAALAGIYTMGHDIANIWEVVDKGFMDSTFYEFYKWLKGEDTAKSIEGKFTNVLEVLTDSKNAIGDKKFFHGLSGTTGQSADELEKSFNSNKSNFYKTLAQNPESLSVIKSMINAEMVSSGNRDNFLSGSIVNGVSERGQLSQTRDLLDGVVKPMLEKYKDPLTEISNKQSKMVEIMNSAKFNEGGLANTVLDTYDKLKESLLDSTDAIKSFMVPALKDSTSYLVKLATGSLQKADKRGMGAITNLPESTKIGATIAAETMKKAGFSPMITSGIRNMEGDNPKSAHFDGKAVDFQLLSGNKFMSQEAIDSEAFKGLITKLAQNKMIEKIILETGSKATGKFTQELYDMVGQEGDKAGGEQNVIHIEFKKLTDDVLGKATALSQIQELMTMAQSELGKQLKEGSARVKGISLEGSTGELTKWNDIMIGLNIVKGTKQSINKIMSSEIQSIDSFFTQYEKDNVPQLGLRAIKLLEEERDLKLSNLKKIDLPTLLSQKASGSLSKVGFSTTVATGLGVDPASLMAKFMMSGMGMSMYKASNRFPTAENDIRDAYNNAINSKEKVSLLTYRQDLQKQSWDYVKLGGGDKKGIGRKESINMFNNAQAKTAFESSMNLKELEDYNRVIKDIYSDITQRKGTIDEIVASQNIHSEVTQRYVDIAMKEYKYIKMNNKEYISRQDAINGDIKAIERLNAVKNKSSDLDKYMLSNSKKVRDSAFGKYDEFLQEGNVGSYGDVLQKGILRSSYLPNEFQIIDSAGQELNTSLIETFQTGFFDMMSGNIKSLGDMFSNLGQSIIGTITGVIAKMLTISATKMVLGIDINASGGLTGGGLLSMLSGGGTSSSGGGIINSVMGLFGGGSRQASIPTTMSDTNLFSSGSTGGSGNLMSSALGMAGGMGLTGMGSGMSLVNTALTGAAGLGVGAAAGSAGGAFSGFLSGAMMETVASYALPLAVAGYAYTELSKDGRIFGGRKDNTGPAQAQLAQYAASKASYEDRRLDDSVRYAKSDMVYGKARLKPVFGGNGTWMSNGPNDGVSNGTFAGMYETQAGISNYQFNDPTYRTWDSGGYSLTSWAPKEKHASTDPTAFYQSLDTYYELLGNAADAHLAKQREMDKTAEKYQRTGIEEELKYQEMIRDLYKAKYDELRVAKDYEGMDEYRDLIAESTDGIIKAQDDLKEAIKEHAYTVTDYEAWLSSNQGGTIKYSETLLKEQKSRLDELELGEDDWYQAHKDYLTSSREYAKTLRDMNKAYSTDRSNNDMSSYNAMFGHSMTAPSEYLRYGSIVMRNKFGMTEQDQATQSEFIKNDYSRIEMERVKRGDYSQSQLMSKYGDLSIDEIISNILGEMNQRTANIMSTTSLRSGEADMLNMLSGSDKKSWTQSDYSAFINRKGLFTQRYGSSNLTAEQDAFMNQQNAGLAGMAGSMTGDVASMASSGLIDINDTMVQSFKNAIENGSYLVDDTIVSIYDSIKAVFESESFTGGILSKFKDADNWDMYNEILKDDAFNNSAIQEALGGVNTTKKEIDPFNYKMTGQMGQSFDAIVDGMSLEEAQKKAALIGYTATQNMKDVASDPWEQAFNFEKSAIETRISGSDEKSTEWYDAYDDLFDLMIENANHLKEKSQEVDDAMTESLDKLNETIKMRIAEERTSTKGDTVFFNVGATRDNEAWINGLVDKIKTKDPKAMEMLEEFRKNTVGLRQ